MSALLLQLSSVLGLSLASGINLYATVAVVGLVTKFDLIQGLPPEFQAFNNDLIITVAIILYACEFLADKIPAFDSLWDSVHTFVRPFGAGLVAMTVVGDAGPTVEILAGLAGASLGLATHTAKAGTRLVANTSPEPFTNIGLSLGEDAAVVGMSVLVMSHPYVSLALSLAIVALLIRFGPGLWRGALLVVRAVPRKIGAALSRTTEVSLKEFMPDAIEEALDIKVGADETIRASQTCHARKVRGCGQNRKGYLIVTDRRLLFAYRRWFTTRTREWAITDLEKTGLNERFLFDVLRVKTGGRFLNFVFLKNRTDAATRLVERLDEAMQQEGTTKSTEDLPKVLTLRPAQ